MSGSEDAAGSGEGADCAVAGGVRAVSLVAFEETRAEIEEAAKGPQAPFNVDATSAARMMLTISGNLRPHMVALSEIGGLNMVAIRKLETRAYALLHALALHACAHTTQAPTEELFRRLRDARRVLKTELDLLILRKIIPADAVKLMGVTGHLATGQDVRAMCSLFLAKWKTIGPEIGGDLGHVTDALMLADQLLIVVAKADELLARQKHTTILRSAAFTLCVESCREAERGIDFLRFHHGDADEIVPSLFDTVRFRKRAKAEDVAPALEDPALADPALADPALADPALADPRTP